MTVFGPLSQPSFRYFWGGMALSTSGFWMQNITVAWLMTDWTKGDPILVSLVQTAMFFPVMFLSLPAGLISDRMDRKWLLIIAHAVMFATPLGLAALIWLDFKSPTLLLLLTLCLAAGNAVKLPAQSALLPDLINKDQLPAAIGLNSMAVNGGRVIGPTLSAALMPILGPLQLLIINSLTYLSFIVVLLRLNLKVASAVVREKTTLKHDLAELVKFTATQPQFAAILLRSGFYFAAWSIVLAVLPLLVTDAANFGIVYSNFGVGAIVGALAMDTIRKRVGAERTLNLAILFHATSITALPFFDSVVAMSVCMFITGVMSFYAMSSFQISAQQLLPREFRGRGLALMTMVMMGSTAISSPLWGWIAHLTSPANSMQMAGICSALALLCTYRMRIDKDLG